MTFLQKATATIGLISLLTFFPVPAASQPFQNRPTMQEWLSTVKAVSEKYGMDANEMLAVAQAEGEKDGYRWYFGKTKTYYLPWGIHKYVVEKYGWQVWNWRVQTEVAIRALAYHKRRKGSLIAGLRCYNKSCNPAYIKRVMSLANKNRKEEVFK